jgi:uncharacterized membrane protein
MNWKAFGYTIFVIAVTKASGLVGLLIVASIIGLIELAVHAVKDKPQSDRSN